MRRLVPRRALFGVLSGAGPGRWSCCARPPVAARRSCCARGSSPGLGPSASRGCRSTRGEGTRSISGCPSSMRWPARSVRRGWSSASAPRRRSTPRPSSSGCSRAFDALDEPFVLVDRRPARASLAGGAQAGSSALLRGCRRRCWSCWRRARIPGSGFTASASPGSYRGPRRRSPLLAGGDGPVAPGGRDRARRRGRRPPARAYGRLGGGPAAGGDLACRRIRTPSGSSPSSPAASAPWRAISWRRCSSASRPRSRELLLRTSILDRVSGPLADSLTGGSGSEAILQELEDANAFVSSLDAGRIVVPLPPSVRRPAPARAATARSVDHGAAAPRSRRLVRASTGRWCGRSAMRRRRAIGAAAARMLADSYVSLLFDGRLATLGALLAGVPGGRRRHRPGAGARLREGPALRRPARGERALHRDGGAPGRRRSRRSAGSASSCGSPRSGSRSRAVAAISPPSRRRCGRSRPRWPRSRRAPGGSATTSAPPRS